MNQQHPIIERLLLRCAHGLKIFSILTALCYPVAVHAAYNDWAEGTQALADGASRDYYNRAGNLEWENYLGDWRDADNASQGMTPFATALTESN